MTSAVYDSFESDVHTGAIDCDNDTFYVMACTASYTENKGVHDRRDDITNEVTGTGYTAGGVPATVTVTKDTTNHRCDISLGAVSWPSSTIANAQKFVYYKRRGGASSADELVAVIDNGTPVSTTAGTLSLGASTFRIQL